MRQIPVRVALGLMGLVGLTLAGCGSGGDGAVSTGDGSGLTPIDKIAEYRGDGGGSLKPQLFVEEEPVDQPQSMAPKLRLDDGPFQRAVPARHVSWFRIGQLTGTTTVVVLLQPTADEDTDLYVLNGNGGSYGTGADLIASSVRYPTDPLNEPGMFGAGLVPDWVAFDMGDTSKFPAAQVAVYGVPGGPSKKHYRIEACEVVQLAANGPAGGCLALGQYASNFWYFDATSGTQYTVNLAATAGDPDVYVYEDEADEYVGADASTGGGSVTFTAGNTCRHYVRVHGYSGTDSNYSINVTSP